MEIYVVSRSRWVKSDTLVSLGELAKMVKLVVPFTQRSEYAVMAARHGCEIVPCKDNGIALTRKFCGDKCVSGKFIMLDDDLKFYRRISSTDWHLRYPADLGASITDLFSLVEKKLDRYAHVAIGAREGNNRMSWPGVECTRPLRALAYRRDEFLSVEHGRVAIMEDFDVTMQLLRKGLKNYVTTSWAQSQIMTQMDGGCSDYRTLELHNTNVRKFAQLHAGFVKLRDKKNKTGGKFGSRVEATIYWKKAYESSARNSK